MALTDENMVMPVSPMYGSNGGFGGGWESWIILFLIFGMFGNGGFGGFGGDGLYPWLNNSQNINGGFRDQFLNDNIISIRDGVNGISTQLCNGFAGVNAGVANGFAQAEIANNARQMADMQQMFGIQSSLQNCCCENRSNIADLKYTVATENCADRAAVNEGVRDLLAATQAQTQTILNQLCQDKIEQKNDTISQLRSELMYARGQASQDVQTAAIQAGQRALANEVEQYVLPTPRPAYIVSNPNCCTNTCGCGM